MSGITFLKKNPSKLVWDSPIRKMACGLSFLLWLALLQTSLAVNVPGPNSTVVTQILSATSSNPEVKVVEDRDLGKILVYPPQPKEFTVKIIARIMYPDDQYLEKISTVMVGGAGVTIESSEIRNSLILATLKVAPGASGGRFSITYENKDNPNHKGCNVRLLPVVVDVVDRDDPTKRWADAKTHSSSNPIYSGEKNGDMIRWKIGDENTLSGATFTWKAEGPETINGPSGAGEFEWSIADGDDDPKKDWVDWKPGKYTITCTIQFAGGGSTDVELEQEVGARTTDLVAVGWIVPANVPLSTVGIPGDMLSFYPPSGDIPLLIKPLTAAHLFLVSQGSIIRPEPAVDMNAAEREYMLNWQFKHGGNEQAPPASFSDEKALEDFKNEKTNYKLYNRFQIKYLLNDQGTEFKGNPIILKKGTKIGTTKDPIAGFPVDGTAGDDEGKLQVKDNKAYYQTNDGSPVDIAVQGHNTLMSPLKWNHIGSSICLGVDFELRFEFLHQVYLTYNLYERQEDGSFVIRKVEAQAPNPKDNFNNNPYDPPLLGDAPFIIK